MNKPNKQNPAVDNTTILNLNKLTSEQPTSSSGESGTIFIKKAANETVQKGPIEVVVPSSARPISPEVMLGVVAHCYANGVYSSWDIEREMLQDQEFRKALGGVVPDPQSIRRFRRLNRQAIQEVLEKFFRRLRKQKSLAHVLADAQPPELPAASVVQPNGAAPASSEASEDTAFIAKRESRERLDKATSIDCMWLDS